MPKQQDTTPSTCMQPTDTCSASSSLLFCNRSEDEYGGSLENRVRILLETIQAVRARVGEDFPIMVKFNHDDYMDEGEGLTVPEVVEVAKMLQAAGADMLEVSGCNETSGKGVGLRVRASRSQRSRITWSQPS